MFGYHFNLTAGHDSASPWWSWPLALKPTWFHVSNFDGRQVALIYNGGNPILFWAGIPALAACARARLEASVAGPGADRGRLRVPARPVDPHRARHVRVPLPDGGDLRDDRRRLRRRRAPAAAGVARAWRSGISRWPRSWVFSSSRSAPPSRCRIGTPTPPAPFHRGTSTSDSPIHRRAIATSCSTLSTMKLLLGFLVAGVAATFAIAGRSLLDGLREPRDPSGEPMVEGR